jgi:hypothetical protein
MMSMKHLPYVLGGAVAVFGVLLISGVPVWTALIWGLLLACPVMMLFSMSRGDSQSPPNGHSDQTARLDSTDDADDPHRSNRVVLGDRALQ